MKVTDDELVSICTDAVEEASGWDNTELSEQRASAMDRYLGEPLGNEQEGRSQVRTREVFDTVQWILPSLMRMFADETNLCEFAAVGPEDEEQAQQETEVVAHIFWQQNRGFYNLLTFFTDALLSKTGILKAWWDDARDEEREEYDGITDVELAQLTNDPEWDREPIEVEGNDDGTFRVVFKSTRERGRVVIEPVPPEEFGVERRARSPYVKDSSFVFHRVRKTRSELIAEGFDREIVDSLPDYDDDIATSRERLARYNLSEESRAGSPPHRSMRNIWVTECYIRIDRDDDGIAELLKVTLATGSPGGGDARLLDVEEVDRVPFSTCSPIILTHKFYGLSIADIVADLQEIKTALLRGTLDNIYLANNGRTGINELVNEDDMLVSRPGGIVRTRGSAPPANSIFPIPQQPVPSQTFGLLEYLDQLRKARTGAGEDVAGLDKNSLANINPSVAAIAYDAARMKIELLARVMAEIGIVPLFRDIHELTQKHATKAMAIRLRGGWAQVNPSEWRSRENIRVKVGLGLASRERRLLALEQIMTKQMEVGASGGMGQLVMPEQIYSTLSRWTDTLGEEASMAWTDPRTVPPTPPKPDPATMQIEAAMRIEAAKNETAKAKLQLEAMKIQSDQQLRTAEMQSRMVEAQARAQVERLRAELSAAKTGAEASTATARAELEAQKAAKAAELKAAELALQDARERARITMEWHKAALASSTTLTVEQMRQMGMGDVADTVESKQAAEVETAEQEAAEKAREAAELRAMMQGIAEMVQQLTESASAPRTIERDASGRAISIGGKPIVRGPGDLIVSIG